jgi:hypothetical protein
MNKNSRSLLICALVLALSVIPARKAFSEPDHLASAASATTASTPEEDLDAPGSVEDIPLPIFVDKSKLTPAKKALSPYQLRKSGKKVGYRLMTLPAFDPTPLNDRSITELTRIAKSFGIEFTSGMSKQQLIDMISSVEDRLKNLPQ